MKNLKMFFVSVPLVLLFHVSGALACPDISGRFTSTFDENDYRKEFSVLISQKGCESITFSDWIVTYRNGKTTIDPSPARTELTDGILRGDLIKSSYTWTPNGLEEFMPKDAHRRCDERYLWFKDAQDKISVTGGFECQ